MSNDDFIKVVKTNKVLISNDVPLSIIKNQRRKMMSSKLKMKLKQ